MNALASNVNFLLGTTLLMSRVINTDFLTTDISFEDGSGNTFTGTLWNEKDKREYRFYFKVKNGAMEDFNMWLPKEKRRMSHV